MSPSGFSPVVHRALVAVAVFTFASWVLIAAALMLWTPGRSLAAGAVSRVARAATAPPAAAPLAAVAMSDLVVPCGSRSSYNYDTGPGSQDFSWCLIEDDGEVWIDDGGSNRSSFRSRANEPRFWFRDHGDEFVVRDPAILRDVRAAAHPLRELSEQMGQLGGELGRHGARMGRIGGRMGAMGARMALIEARLARGTASRERHTGVDGSMDGSMRELRSEMAELRAQLDRERSEHDDAQRALSHRMSELSARHHEVLIEVRKQVRAIAERARREGKAERPHANA